MQLVSCLGMQLVIFCSLLLAWPSVNFDVCSIAFVIYLLNGVPFSIFVLISIIVMPQTSYGTMKNCLSPGITIN